MKNIYFLKNHHKINSTQTINLSKNYTIVIYNHDVNDYLINTILRYF